MRVLLILLVGNVVLAGNVKDYGARGDGTGSTPADEGQRDIIEQTYLVLCNLGHSETDARRLLDSAVENGSDYQDVESLLQVVYQSSQP